MWKGEANRTSKEQRQLKTCQLCAVCIALGGEEKCDASYVVMPRLLEEQKRMEQLLVQNKLNSEKLILEKEQNEEVLRNKMMVLQQEMERKKIHMDLVMKSNTKNHGKNQENGGGNKEEEEEKKLAQLRVEMKDAELQMKRLQQEQLENEKKKNQAEENLLVAETELEVVQESIQDNTEEQQGDNLNEKHRKRQQKERARELAAKEKAERDQQRVDELNKRMNAALMNNDTIGVRHLNENLKAAKKDLLKRGVGNTTELP